MSYWIFNMAQAQNYNFLHVISHFCHYWKLKGDISLCLFHRCCCYCLVLKLCLILLQPHLPGSSIHGISQARILEWVAISFSRDLPNPVIEQASPALAGEFFTTREALVIKCPL